MRPFRHGQAPRTAYSCVAWATGGADAKLSAIAAAQSPRCEDYGVKSLTSRYFLPLGNVAASLFLGALAFGVFWYYFPDATLQLFKWAGSIREAVVGGYLPARYEVVVRALVDERQI